MPIIIVVPPSHLLSRLRNSNSERMRERERKREKMLVAYIVSVHSGLFVCLVSKIFLTRTTRLEILSTNDVIGAQNTRSVECELARNYCPGLGKFWYMYSGLICCCFFLVNLFIL